MKISVNEQEQRFYLATKNGWQGAVGHEIKVGEYSFCAIPTNRAINVSEVSSGIKIADVPYSVGFLEKGKNGVMELFEKIGEDMKNVIKDNANFDKAVKQEKSKAIDLLGEKPQTENVNLEKMLKE